MIVSATVATFEHRKTLSLAAKKLWTLITKGRVPIIVFGPGGVGKTTLGHFLETPEERLLAMAKYDRSVETEEFNLGGPVVARVFVPPGQEFRRELTWPHLYTMLAQEKRALVVNVVSDGYHVLNLEPALLSELTNPGAKRKEILEAFLARGREKELAVVRAVTDHICKIESRVSMITVVTKQDLWWEHRDQVQKHYEHGTYNRCVESILQAKGAQGFHHEFVSVSLVANNLCTDSGEVVFPTARGYDENIQVAHQHKLMATLFALIKAI